MPDRSSLNCRLEDAGRRVRSRGSRPGGPNDERRRGSLTALRILHLKGCTGLNELPASFGSLTALVTLTLSGCTGLNELPATLGSLTALKSLNLDGCTGLNELPRHLGFSDGTQVALLALGSNTI